MGDLGRDQAREYDGTGGWVSHPYSIDQIYEQEEPELQFECLENQQEQIRIFAELLRQADRTTINKSADVARTMGSSTDCLDPKQLGTRASMPVNPRERVEVQGLCNELAKSKMLLTMEKKRIEL